MKKYIFLFFIIASSYCLSGYTANHKSIVTWVKIYNNNTIFFGLKTMPTDHGCSDNFFAISPSLTEKQRDRYYSMLLAAKASGIDVDVGYDKLNPQCLDNRPIAQALSF